MDVASPLPSRPTVCPACTRVAIEESKPDRPRPACQSCGKPLAPGTLVEEGATVCEECSRAAVLAYLRRLQDDISALTLVREKAAANPTWLDKVKL